MTNQCPGTLIAHPPFLVLNGSFAQIEILHHTYAMMSNVISPVVVIVNRSFGRPLGLIVNPPKMHSLFQYN